MSAIICKYSQDFVIADWVVNGANSEIIVTGLTHCRGIYPIVQVFQLVSGEYRVVYPLEIDVNPTTGTVTIAVLTANVFDGRVLIL